MTFFLFYVLWKYRFLWQLGQPRSTDSGGRFFPTALQHIFVGLYIEEILLAALFFLARDSNSKASAVPQGALMIILIVITVRLLSIFLTGDSLSGSQVFFHLILDNSYDPLIHALPLTLADEDQELPDPNKQAAEQELQDNASATSVEAARAEKRGYQEMRVRTPSQHSGGTGASGKARAKSIGRSQSVGRNTDSLAPGDDEESNRLSQFSVRGIDEEEGPKDFYHPASIEPQQTIWIPHDTLGLCEAEEAALRERGIRVSSADALMDEKGHVDISGAPPDEVKEAD